MKPYGLDVLPLAGLAAAVIVLFATPLSRVIASVRELEEQTGLLLLPAFVILVMAAAIHMLRTRYAARADAAIEEVRREEGARRADEQGRLMAFGQALGRSTDFDAIRVSIAQFMPAIAGTERVWVLVREGTQWHALAGDTRGSEDALKWGDLAEQLLAGAHAHGGDSDRALGFPLTVGSAAVGVLGVRPANGELTPDQRRAIEAACPVIGLAIRQAQLTRELRENSVRDALTGCFTHGHALEVVDAELRRARRSQAPVSLIMFDVDRLKDVNDRHGHLCGDAVLGAIGKRMREVLRGSDLKCRYSGEQFLVLLPETPIGGAKRVAETLRREVADRPVAWAGEQLRITASFGLAQALSGEVNVAALIGRAEQAVHRAKDAGGNCLRLAPEGIAVSTDTGDSTLPLE